LANWFAKPPSAPPRPTRRKLRIGIPRALNVWSTHQFWFGLFRALGIETRDIVFSSETSEKQFREFGQGRGTVDCCHPVKCLVGHYGELLYGQKRKIDVLFSPMIYSLPSFLKGSVADNLTCPRVMAGAENIRAGFIREKDLFAEAAARLVSPIVCLADPRLCAKQIYEALAPVMPDLTRQEADVAVSEAYASLAEFDQKMRASSRNILEDCALNNQSCVLILARPYHMDPGIGHEIETEIQSYGYPILWGQYLPLDRDMLDWLFGEDVRRGAVRSPLDISDVWRSSYSANTNELLWAAKFAARMPWVSCVIRLSSYECGMDQPTYSPVQSIVESSGTLFFSFQDLDSTKSAGSVRIRTETIAHYLREHSGAIVARKLARLPARVPPATRAAAQQAEVGAGPATSNRETVLAS
jgi:predicted nucleotide-binding protein (sugar kinase/HSP70/actin superfamily)